MTLLKPITIKMETTKILKLEGTKVLTGVAATGSLTGGLFGKIYGDLGEFTIKKFRQQSGHFPEYNPANILEIGNLYLKKGASILKRAFFKKGAGLE